MDRLIKNEPKPGIEYNFMNVSFNNLIETIAHEIAHAYQITVNNFKFDEVRSQCKSSGEGERDSKGELIKPKYPELVADHTELTNEILQLILSSPEYQKLKK